MGLIQQATLSGIKDRVVVITGQAVELVKRLRFYWRSAVRKSYLEHADLIALKC
ncbi:hypothetical protein [Paenibacillus sp. FSL L8-0158]|uniref:hypothetical protein n=1 Tax=Paenibacillus sp. FSL L8-0158 TaxID=2954752 RepID=UPI0031582787